MNFNLIVCCCLPVFRSVLWVLEGFSQCFSSSLRLSAASVCLYHEESLSKERSECCSSLDGSFMVGAVRSFCFVQVQPQFQGVPAYLGKGFFAYLLFFSFWQPNSTLSYVFGPGQFSAPSVVGYICLMQDSGPKIFSCPCPRDVGFFSPSTSSSQPAIVFCL